MGLKSCKMIEAAVRRCFPSRRYSPPCWVLTVSLRAVDGSRVTLWRETPLDHTNPRWHFIKWQHHHHEHHNYDYLLSRWLSTFQHIFLHANAAMCSATQCCRVCRWVVVGGCNQRHTVRTRIMLWIILRLFHFQSDRECMNESTPAGISQVWST